MDTAANRTAASEALKLQEKVNELSQQLDEVNIHKKSLIMKVKELEHNQSRSSKTATSTSSSAAYHHSSGRIIGGGVKEDELLKKLRAAEQLCEELMDENTVMKKDVRNLEQEIDEMHDNFGEVQSERYAELKKELEKEKRNCRIQTFQYHKSERKIAQLEIEKQSAASQLNSDMAKRVKQLEEDLRKANEALKVGSEKGSCAGNF